MYINPISVDNPGKQDEPGFYANISAPSFTQLSTRALDENTIKDLYVVQFVDNVAVFVDNYTGINFSNKLNIPLKSASANDVVFFFANIKEVAPGSDPISALVDVGKTTLQTFQVFELPVNYPETIENFYPMRGVYQGAITEGAVTNANIVLQRLVAKLNFTFDSSPFVGFTPTSVQLCHVPVGMTLAPMAIATLGEADPTGFVAYPVGRGGNSHISFDMEAITGIGGTFSWTIAENVRGSWSEIATNLQKNPDAQVGDAAYVPAAAEKGFYTEGKYATYIELAGETSTGSVRYKIYLGGNERGDMNLLGNVEYNITTRILGINSVDTRITCEDTAQTPGESNSYIVSAGAKRELRIPTSRVDSGIAALNAIETPATPLTFDNINYTVAVVWQSWNSTVEGALVFGSSQPDYFKVTIPATVKNGNNAILAVKNSAGEILWSWHLWLTDYKPERKNERYISPYFDDGTVMMDRNLGATWTEQDGHYIHQTMTTTGIDDIRAMKAFGLMYQWGRKDPFASVTGRPAMASPMYDGVGALIDSGETGGIDWIDLSTDAGVKYIEATQNPRNFYFFGTNKDWAVGELSLQGFNHELWDVGYLNPSDANKSIFDPCPVGWRVPLISAEASNNPFAGFHNGDPNSTSMVDGGDGTGVSEWYFKGKRSGGVPGPTSGRFFNIQGHKAWYPATGYYGPRVMPYNTGINEFGVAGSFWGRDSYYDPVEWIDDGRQFLFFNDEVMPAVYNYRQSGYTIRCESRFGVIRLEYLQGNI